MNAYAIDVRPDEGIILVDHPYFAITIQKGYPSVFDFAGGYAGAFQGVELERAALEAAEIEKKVAKLLEDN